MVNRLTHRAPALPATVGALERKVVVLSEVSLYALLLIQPLLGWAMVSAAGGPVVVFGSLRLPRIAPFDAQLFWLLRQAHSVVAYALMAAIAAHISAIAAAYRDVARPTDRADDIRVGQHDPRPIWPERRPARLG